MGVYKWLECQPGNLEIESSNDSSAFSLGKWLTAFECLSPGFSVYIEVHGHYGGLLCGVYMYM